MFSRFLIIRTQFLVSSRGGEGCPTYAQYLCSRYPLSSKLVQVNQEHTMQYIPNRSLTSTSKLKRSLRYGKHQQLGSPPIPNLQT